MKFGRSQLFAFASIIDCTNGNARKLECLQNPINYMNEQITYKLIVDNKAYYAQ